MPTDMIMKVLFASGVLSFASAGKGGHDALNLTEFQRILRSSLDSELVKIIDGSKIQNSDIPDSRSSHTKKRSNIRRRTAIQDSDQLYDEISSTSRSRSSPSYFAEHVWDDLIQHAWDIAQTIRRDKERGLSITTDPLESHPFPFLVCTRGRDQEGSGSSEDILTLFDKPPDESLFISSSHNESCLLLTATAFQAYQAAERYEGSQSVVVVPLLDISKIHAGTVDEVSSSGWSVPFHETQDQTPNGDPSMKNETEAMNEWERMIVVDFVPGLGGMKEEAQLLDVVNKMMGDIQDMGEVGWLKSMGKEEAEQFLVDESLLGVPALSDMFSLTSPLRSINTNDKQSVGKNSRIIFWQDSFKKGIESEHACSEMFSTLFVKPRAGYYSYDLVLNPHDGPPPRDYESSAANPACVTSLIAALSTHPYVLSVKANFPIYHGWHVAQKLDSF